MTFKTMNRQFTHKNNTYTIQSKQYNKNNSYTDSYMIRFAISKSFNK